MPDDAVDIFDPAAMPTNQMMMIVTNARFVERRGIAGFDAAHQSDLQQGMEIIVDGLRRQAPKAFPSNDGNGIGSKMTALVNRRQDREPGRRNPHPHRSQPFLEHVRIRLHVPMIVTILESVKKMILSNKFI